MNYKIIKDGSVVNTIVADEDFCKAYCEKHGYTYELVPDQDAPMPAEVREDAYNTEKIIPWNGAMLTITEATQLWMYYAAEGSDNAGELQALIASAKDDIRKKYPDEGSETV